MFRSTVRQDNVTGLTTTHSRSNRVAVATYVVRGRAENVPCTVHRYTARVIIESNDNTEEGQSLRCL
jgi:hypothetical protein